MTRPAIVLDPVDLLLMVSAASVGAGESPPNTNAGPYVRRTLAVTGNKEGDPWCASQVSRWGQIAFGKRWPLPLSAGVMALCNAAERHGIRYIPGQSGKGAPQIGDLYALWYPKKKRWAHIGLVVEVKPGTLRILARDGNTSDPKDTDPETNREGWLVAEKWRTLTPNDRLIRWWQKLEPPSPV